ncbi:hypothetical protein K470DRAFT_272613 [Piedraia hortae CBS 480.64]|uniref:DDE-1 domain-containing protein n=1 Tax=Piedraia hortae CBS 480.64 TaxID=1314780 RepID=A0A6A7BSR9_9PEZI|nr:hypothetical protein K470DRAFT_272613 [Piedraia hortae CBS 480.64]
MDAALSEPYALVENGIKPNFAATAKKHLVNRTTLYKRSQGLTADRDTALEARRSLSKEQSEALVKYISFMCDWCLPPSLAIVLKLAQSICQQDLGKSWPDWFVERNRKSLDCRYMNGIDLLRHKADSRKSYRAYFEVLEKIQGLKIQPENVYNMDGKGFLIGKGQKIKRRFARNHYEQGRLIGAGQDGNREWVTVMATICRDGNTLPPTVIYASASGTVQDSWVEESDTGKHTAYFAATNGWTNDKLGCHWLIRVFDKATSGQARRRWRLLLVDSHGLPASPWQP